MSEAQAVPKSGPRAKSKNSKNQKRLARRTAENMTPKMLERRHLFIEGLLKGMHQFEAAIYAGVPARSANKEGSSLKNEPYVVKLLEELREATEEEKLITRKELLLNVKGIAFNHREQGGARVGASALLARIMGYEAPTVVKNKHEFEGGVMAIPVIGTVEEWEAAARAAQDRLKADVRT